MSIKKYLFCICLMIPSISVVAETTVKGIAEISYESWGDPSADEIASAKKKAIKSSLSRWASKQGGSFLKNYDLIRGEIDANISDFVLGKETLSEKIDKDSKQYRVVMKVVLDDVRLKNFINDSSSVANVDEDDKSYMTFIFVSRRQTVVQSFDNKVYKREDSLTSESGSESESSYEDGLEFSAQTNESNTTTTGGSTTRRADQISYDVAPSSEINISMSEVFSTSGFEVVEAEYLEEESNGLVSVSSFIEDYRHGDDISGSTKRNAAKGARLLDVPFVALGTLDIGMAETDSSSGLVRVSVTVTGKMINVEKRFPKTVAAVGPIQIAGLGPNQTVAETNALKLASEKAANELVNQLNAKAIK